MFNREEFLAQIKATVLAFDDKAQVILFGSRARGDFNEDSDWDVLVLTSSEAAKKHKDSIIESIYDIELKYGQAVSALIKSKTDWEYWEIRPLNRNVAKEGVVI